MTEKLVIGIILMLIGLLFFFNNKNMGKGSAKFYKWLYTEKNLVVIFRIVGVLLVVGGAVILSKGL